MADTASQWQWWTDGVEKLSLQTVTVAVLSFTDSSYVVLDDPRVDLVDPESYEHWNSIPVVSKSINHGRDKSVRWWCSVSCKMQQNQAAHMHVDAKAWSTDDGGTVENNDLHQGVVKYLFCDLLATPLQYVCELGHGSRAKKRHACIDEQNCCMVFHKPLWCTYPVNLQEWLLP